MKQLSFKLVKFKNYQQLIFLLNKKETLVCPQNCLGRGLCKSGNCQCFSNFIDEDCSQRSEILQLGVESYSIINGGDSEYYYFDLSDFTNEITLTIKKQEDYQGDLIIVIGITSDDSHTFPYPDENQQYTQVYQIPYAQNLQIYSVSTNYLGKYIGEQNAKFIVGIYNEENNDIIVKVLVNQKNQPDSSSSDSNSSIVIIYTIIAVQEKLTTEIINEYMPVIQYQYRKNNENISKNQKENCAVCLVDFEPNSDCRETICWHIFHKDCLDSWLRKHENCPYCRHSLSIKDLKENQLHPKQLPRNNQEQTDQNEPFVEDIQTISVREENYTGQQTITIRSRQQNQINYNPPSRQAQNLFDDLEMVYQGNNNNNRNNQQ